MLQYFDILKEQYDQNKFQKFGLELFNNASLSVKKLEIDQHFSSHIESFTYLGSYEDPQGKKLHILDVNLKTQIKLEQARTMQRNLIAKYLKDHWLDGSLVAFHTDASDSWRLSFVKVEYRFDEQGKTKEEITPAKRYSFLVGEGEPTHTAQTQLAKIYQQIATNPTFAQLEEAFGVEKVTKEFFEKYRDLFETVLAELKTNHTFQNEAVKNNIDTPSFAKKLLGQIVFLYFLQKKGWLGVPKGKSWGEGDRFFLSNLFTKAQNKSENFFNNYLEVLFYDTLNNPRRNEVDPSYSKYFDSRIPFLNGGLFEPQYDWKNSQMYLDNKVFEKILGIFDQYNFTVKEDEPLEKEVAVDPEMLGKVFENLLEENLRKGKGTYYTPREIVHYMCQESLINYLVAESNIQEERIRSLVMDDAPYAFSPEETEKLDTLLKNIEIVDPACGSGAFLVGMLQQIVRARQILALFNQQTISEYDIKKQTIQNCIYGVDIDPGAIDIAKLRLWLSLVVDYDLEEIEPLPNLDYKLMVGNSLVEKLDSNFLFKGIDSKKNELIDELKNIKNKYFDSSDSKIKSELRVRINELIRLLINYDNEQERNKIWAQILGRKNQMKMFAFDEEQQSFGDVQTYTKKLQKLTDIKETDHFEWHLNFNEVFERGGFDIVIANPPYIKEYTQKSAFDGLRDSPYYQGKMDLWYLFACKGIDLSKENSGLIVFIAQNNWTTSYGASKMRNKVLRDAQILSLIDFGDFKVFDAGIQTMVMMFKRNSSEESYLFDYRKLLGSDLKLNDALSLLNKTTQKNTEYLSPQINRKDMLNKKLSFSNSDTELVLEKISSMINFRLDPTKEVAQGIVCPQDYVNRASQEILGNKFKIGTGIFVLTNEEVKQLNLTKKDKILLKPFYTTTELVRWTGNPVNKRQIIYTDSSFKSRDKIENFPNIKRHFDQFKKVITSDNAPYGLHRARDEYFFKGEKIIVVRKCVNPTFTYVDFDSYVSATFYVIKTERINQKYLVAILNSKLIAFWLKHKGKMQGNNYQIDKEPIIELPLFEAGKSSQEEIEKVVDKIIKITGEVDYLQNLSKQNQLREYEKQIDQMVYKLYRLTLEEIAVVESSNM